MLNRPEGILAANEKLYALHFPDLMPETVVTRDIGELNAFLEKMGGEMVVKPLDGRGGEGVFHVATRDRNLSSILEQSTRFGTRRAMAQRYLANVSKGDKRILLLEGEPLGALLRSRRRASCARTSTSAGRPRRGRARRRTTAASSSASRRGSAPTGSSSSGSTSSTASSPR